MKTIDKISEYGNIFFAALLYTSLTISIGGMIGSHMTQSYQLKRLERKEFFGYNCYSAKDIKHIITGEYEFLK